MPRVTSQQQLIDDVLTARQKLDETLATVPQDKMEEAGVCEAWSVKDILAHLLEWQQMVLRWYRAGIAGQVPKTPADDLTWRQTPELNQRIYEKHRDRPLEDIQAEFEASHHEILGVIKAVPEADLLEKGRYKWTKSSTLGSYFVSATSSHYKWARDLIRKWVKAQA